MNLEHEFSLSVSFLQARNLAVPKNTPQKTDADTQTMISILSHNLEGHYCMKKRRCWWNPRLVEVPYVQKIVSWSVLWTVIFWLINLSDGLIFADFCLRFTTRWYVFDILFLNYMFPISLWICSLWVCSSRNIVLYIKLAFKISKNLSDGRFLFNFVQTSGGKGEANQTQRKKIPILYSIEKLG